MRKFILIFLAFYIQSNAQEKLDVFFDFNRYEINIKAKNKIDSLILNRKNIEIQKIYGFADSVDTNKYNDSLSLKRAKAIANYFSLQKIKLNKTIEIKGFGENQNTENSNFNRKVIIYFKYLESPKFNPNSSENSRFDTSENKQVIQKIISSEKSISEKFQNVKKDDIIVFNNI